MQTPILQPDEVTEILGILRLRLYYLERKEAMLGMLADPSIVIERDIIIAKMERLRKELALHESTCGNPAPAQAAILPDEAEISFERPPWEAMARLERGRLLRDGSADIEGSGEKHMNKKILVVDNDADYLGSLTDYLETIGYEVYRAETIERARQMLEYVWVHVVIIDIRLRDDRDPKDTSGLLLAKDPAYHSVPKIMLTRYPTIAAVREALSHALKGLPPAVDFIDKRDPNPQVLLTALDDAFKQHARLNFALNIAWSQPLSFPALINRLQAEHDNTRLLDRCAELEDLLRKLFYESKQLTIGRVLRHASQRIVLEVFAYSEAGAERQYVVSCGNKTEIAAETQRYSNVAPNAGGNNSTIKALEAETVRFAAAAYMLSNGDLEEITSFREYYQSKPQQLVAASLQRLYHETLAAWYRKGRKQLRDQGFSALLLEALGLRSDRLAPETLGHQCEALGQHIIGAGLARQIEGGNGHVIFRFHDNTTASYADPIFDRYEQLLNPKLTILSGFIHGNIDAESILVDGTGQVWLIDFSRAGRAPLLLDLVEPGQRGKTDTRHLTTLRRLERCSG